MIQILGITYTDEMPMRPPDAEFGVTIDFVRGKSDPVAVFSAMTELLSAFSAMDRVLVGAVAPEAESTNVIEDIEAASVTAWLRNILKKTDDDALKSMDWKKQVGGYLVKAKYRIIEFLDDREQKHNAQRLETLRADLHSLGMSVPQAELLPPVIDLKALVAPMNQVQDAKAQLTKGETLIVKSDSEGDRSVDVESNQPVAVPDDFFREDAPQEIQASPMQMDLLVRKPDLIGNSQWEFKAEGRTIRAKIEDENWLRKFHRNEVPIPPGSHMRATVAVADGGSEVITKVHGIIPPSPLAHADLFG